MSEIQIRNQIEENWLDDIDGVPGFHVRENNTIEREVCENEENTEKMQVISGEYYDRVEIITRKEFLEYCEDSIRDEIVDRMNPDQD